MKIIAVNKSINYEYFVLERYEAGIDLLGVEVKSIRAGNVSIKESFIFIRNGQMSIKNMHIAQYDKGSFSNVDPLRDRKLLMHKREIDKLFGKINEKGYTIVPDKVYLKGSLIKMEIALCQGKKEYDKRRTIKDREEKRNIARVFKEYNN